MKTYERIRLRLSPSQPALYVCVLIIIQYLFMNVPSEQPDGQLQKQHNVETQITKDS
jgi:hypothetical protein